MKTLDFFAGFQVSKPEFNLLAVGEHIVRIIRAEEVTSFQQFNGDEKLKLPAWKDATPQLAVTIVAAEPGKSGGLTHRFNGRGYDKMNELSAEQRASGDYQDVEGYACAINGEGLLVRSLSDKHTKECANILNQFAAAIGAKEKDNLGAVIEKAISGQVKFSVLVVNKPHMGKDQLRLERFKAISNVAVKADFED